MEIPDPLLREDVRLVTLTGPAGIAKTRLAIEAAQETENSFEHTRFVNLFICRDFKIPLYQAWPRCKFWN